MKDNYKITIAGEKVALLPYYKCFVEKYHEWMQDPFILEMTASEPLSLQEEYEMQESWKNDSLKCTFILSSGPSLSDMLVRGLSHPISIDCLIGDINLFLNDPDDRSNAEIDVMVAESSYRQQGIASEAIKLLMSYAVQHLNIRRFYAKINQQNQPSIKLFQSLGYLLIKYVEAFQEFEYEFLVNDDTKKDDILQRVSYATYGDCEEPAYNSSI